MNKISLIILFSLITLSGLIAQWNVSNNSVNWNPTNSPGLPITYYNHAAAISSTATIAIAGAAGSTYPICGSSQLQLTFSLAGGATFIGANGNAVVSSSGDWEGRFTWNLVSPTVLTATLNTAIPLSPISGTASNTFTFAVLTPSYSSQFFFSTQTTGGTGGGCNGSNNPNTNTNDDAQSINAFTNRSLPIQSLDFNSIEKQFNGIRLNWKTLYEQNTLEFEVERKYSNEESWMTIGKTPAAGQSVKELTYSYSDDTYAQRDKIYYRIKQVDVDGTYSYTNIKGIELKKNIQVKLDGYPNPVKGLYHLKITGAKDDKVSIDVFDILGRSVSRKTLSIIKGSNYHDLIMGFNTSNTYIVRVSSPEINESMTVVKVD